MPETLPHQATSVQFRNSVLILLLSMLQIEHITVASLPDAALQGRHGQLQIRARSQPQRVAVGVQRLAVFTLIREG